jgi:transposase InsO family protein
VFTITGQRVHDLADCAFTIGRTSCSRSPEYAKVIPTPVKAPRANAYAERWVRTVRTECLDWLLILNQRHLKAVLRVYVRYYNAERPHRGLKLSPPEGPREPIASAVCATVCRQDLLGGLLHEYYRAAA